MMQSVRVCTAQRAVTTSKVASFVSSRRASFYEKRQPFNIQKARKNTLTTCAAASDSLSTVKLLIQGRHLPVTPAIKEYAENKINKALHNFEGSIKEVDMRFSASGNHGKAGEAHHQRNQKAEITVYTLRHGVVRVEDIQEDLYAAIDLSTDKLKRKMNKLKEKAIQRNTWPGRGGTKGGTHIEDVLDDDLSDSELPVNELAAEPAPEIVREKILLLGSRMSQEEAMEQLEAIGHDFFVFVDAKDGQMKIVYKRISHGYGLLVPQME